jgi:lipopolysaccharide/colanic/teichoic acid biosynthesis glycosyltransferase
VVKLDLEYIDNWSIYLDVKILIKTVGAIFTHSGK